MPRALRRLVSNPPNPWRSSEVEYLEEIPETHRQVFEDATRSILSKNDEAAVGFIYGLNPYRGCEHACAYCEARRRHELLGFGAGTDFDTKIVVKPDAAALLREAFDKPSWQGDLIVMSGATDCYQPLEASYKLTRQCLEVCAEYRNPVAIVTKGALIERDVDLLVRLRDVARVTVTISIPFWDADVARLIEPGAPTPSRRMQTVQRLAANGIDVGVAFTPMIVGLGEDRLANLIEAAATAGATRATLGFLRLPRPVDGVFAERLTATLPHRAPRILANTADAATSSQTKTAASMIEHVYLATCRRVGLPCFAAGDDRANTPSAGPRETRTFRRPSRQGQLEL